MSIGLENYVIVNDGRGSSEVNLLKKLIERSEMKDLRRTVRRWATEVKAHRNVERRTLTPLGE
ncbi:MAG: hypothetical protein ACTS41_01240 [Candidatus Hodgkinia cicadicola]